MSVRLGGGRVGAISVPGRPTYLDKNEAKSVLICAFRKSGLKLFGQFLLSATISLFFALSLRGVLI